MSRDGQPGDRERPAGRFHRAHAHQLRGQGADTGGDDPGKRLEAQFAGARVTHDHDGGGPVIERARVPGRHGAAAAEDRLQGADGLCCHAGTRRIVAVHHRAVGAGIRRDFAGVEPGGDGRLGPVLAEHRPGVLLRTGDAVACGDVLRRLAHGDVHVRHPAAQPRVGPRRVGGRAGLGAFPGRLEARIVRAGVGLAGTGPVPVAGHRLHPGGHERLAFAGLDGVEGHPERLQAGGTKTVDGGGRNVVQPGQDADHAGHVGAGLAAGLGAPQIDVVQAVARPGGGVERRNPGEGRRDHGRGEIVRPFVFQGPFERPADRAPGSRNDDSFWHAPRLRPA